jgi:putative FmdB family regulatory protein
MPIYEYQCKKCGKVTDKFFKMEEKPSSILEECECGNDELVSIISSTTIVSGVGGFKVPTDFKSRLDQIRKHYPNMQSSV